MTETKTAKPSLPEGYVVPEVWRPTTATGGAFAGTNRPTAGAWEEEELQRGEHPYQLYSLGTPNGQKVTILLEELGVDYDAWKIPISGKQFGSGFVALNPNSKIPALYDHSGSESIRLFESGSILVHIAEKHGQFFPGTDRPAARAECMNWLMWQMGSAPFIGGGFGHFFSYAPMNDEYAINRYSMETKRLLDVLDKHLAEGSKQYVLGDEYSIADMAIYPWIRCLDVGYKNANGVKATDFLQLDSYTQVKAWMARLAARKAVQRGLRVNSFEGFVEKPVAERHSASDFTAADYDQTTA